MADDAANPGSPAGVSGAGSGANSGTPSKLTRGQLVTYARRMKPLINKLREELKASKEANAALEAQLAEQSAANATLREQLQEQARHSQSIQENAEAETAELRTKLSVALRSVDDLTAKLDRAEERTAVVPGSPDGHMHHDALSTATHETTREVLRERLNLMESELQAKLQHVDDVERKHDETRSKAKDLMVLYKRMQGEIAELRTAASQATELQAKVEALTASCETLTEQRDQAVNECTDAKRRMEEAVQKHEAEAAALRARVETLESASTDAAVSATERIAEAMRERDAALADAANQAESHAQALAELQSQLAERTAEVFEARAEVERAAGATEAAAALAQCLRGVVVKFAKDARHATASMLRAHATLSQTVEHLSAEPTVLDPLHAEDGDASGGASANEQVDEWDETVHEARARVVASASKRRDAAAAAARACKEAVQANVAPARRALTTVLRRFSGDASPATGAVGSPLASPMGKSVGFGSDDGTGDDACDAVAAAGIVNTTLKALVAHTSRCRELCTEAQITTVQCKLDVSTAKQQSLARRVHTTEARPSSATASDASAEAASAAKEQCEALEARVSELSAQLESASDTSVALSAVESERDAAVAAASAAKEQCEALEARVSELSAQLESADDAVTALSTVERERDAAAAAASAEKEQCEALEARVSELSAQLESASDTSAALSAVESERDAAVAAASAAKEQCEALEARVSELSAQLESANDAATALSAVESERDAAAEAASAAKEQCEALEARVSELSAQLESASDTSAALSAVESERDLAVAAASAAKEQCEALEARVKDWTDTSKGADDSEQLAQLKAKAAMHEQALKKLVPRYKASQQQVERLKKLLRAATAKLQALQAQVKAQPSSAPAGDTASQQQQHRMASLAQEVEQYRAQASDATDKLVVAQRRVAELTEQQETLRHEAAAAQETIGQLRAARAADMEARRKSDARAAAMSKADMNRVQAEATSWAEKHDAVRRELDETTAQVAQYRTQLANAQRTAEETVQSLTTNMEEQSNRWDEERTTLEQQLRQAKEDVKRLQAELEAAQAKATNGDEKVAQLVAAGRKLKALLAKQHASLQQAASARQALEAQPTAYSVLACVRGGGDVWCFLQRWDTAPDGRRGDADGLLTRHEWVRLKTVQEWTDAYRRESRPGSDTQSALTAAEAFLLPASGVTNADDGDAPAPAEGSDAPAADAAAAGVQALPEWLPPTLQEAAAAAVASGQREAAEKLDAATQQLQAAEAEIATLKADYQKYRVRAAAALKKAMGRGGGDDSSDLDRSDSNSSSEVAALRQRLTAAQDELKSTTAALRSEQEAVRALTAKLEQREEEAADEVAAAVQRAEQAETQLRDSQALWQKNLEEGLAESNDAARSTANQLQAEVASLNERVESLTQERDGHAERAARFESLLHTSTQRCSALQSKLVAAGVMAEEDMSFGTPRSALTSVPGDRSALFMSPMGRDASFLMPTPLAGRGARQPTHLPPSIGAGTADASTRRRDADGDDHTAESPRSHDIQAQGEITAQLSVAERDAAIARQLADILQGGYTGDLPSTGMIASDSVGGHNATSSHTHTTGGARSNEQQASPGHGGGDRSEGSNSDADDRRGRFDERAVLERVVGHAVIGGGSMGGDQGAELAKCQKELRSALAAVDILREELVDAESLNAKHLAQIRVLKEALLEAKLSEERQKKLRGAKLGKARRPSKPSDQLGHKTGEDSPLASPTATAATPAGATMDATRGTDESKQGDGTRSQPRVQGSDDEDQAINLQYLKNIVVQYMLAAEPDDQRRMLPAVATMLGFTNAERAKVMKHIQAAEASGVTGVIGRAATGIFSVFGSS